jgi:hypothetical protein
MGRRPKAGGSLDRTGETRSRSCPPARARPYIPVSLRGWSKLEELSTARTVPPRLGSASERRNPAPRNESPRSAITHPRARVEAWGMSAEERDPPGGQAAALGFYFNADDTLRTGPAAAAQPWEPTWVQAEPDDRRPVEAPAPRRGSRLLIALALLLIAGTAIAVAWSLTPDRRVPLAPAVAPQLPPAAPPPDRPAAALASPAPAVTETPAARPPSASAKSPPRQHLRPGDRRHAATGAHAGRPHHHAQKQSKPHGSKPAPSAAHSPRPTHARSAAHSSHSTRSSPAPCRTQPCR